MSLYRYLNNYHILIGGICAAFLLGYLLLGTGVFSDDYMLIVLARDESSSFLYPSTFIATPVLHYTHAIFYNIFKTDYILYDLLKLFWLTVSFLMVDRFFSLFVNKYSSKLISLFFVLFPISDSTTYWFLAQYLTLTVSFYLFSYYLAYKDKLFLAFIFALLASFVSYGSTPVAFGLFVLFVLKGDGKKSLVVIIPNIIYILYYIYLTKVLVIGTQRLHSDSLLEIIRNYVLQIGTLIDTFIGPSFWLKIYYGIMEISILSFIIGSGLIYFFYNTYTAKKEKIDKDLFVSLFIMVLSALGMFSLTGLYPQMAFNLGNRVAIYGSILVSFMIVVYLMRNQKSATLMFSILILSFFGTSDHWKLWNKHQLKVIDNISQNQQVKEFDKKRQLFFSYNQYSKLGDLSHIEFITQQSMASTIFKVATGETYKVSTLNRRFINTNEWIIDKKFGSKVKIDDVIDIYDSESNILIKIKKDDIQKYINTLPKDNRHWMQLLDKDNFIMKIVLSLMPRLEYAI